MAQQKMRVLKSQILDERDKNFRMKSKLKSQKEYDDDVLELDDADMDNLPDANATFCSHYSRPTSKSRCEVCSPQRSRTSSGKKLKISDTSMDHLLNASLNSLENLGRHLESKRADETVTGGYKASGSYPTVDFLNGALWLGRNLSMAAEDAVESVDSFKTKFLRDIGDAMQDPDPERSVKRLHLLGGTGMAEVSSVVHRASTRIRDMLKVSLITLF